MHFLPSLDSVTMTSKCNMYVGSLQACRHLAVRLAAYRILCPCGPKQRIQGKRHLIRERFGEVFSNTLMSATECCDNMHEMWPAGRFMRGPLLTAAVESSFLCSFPQWRQVSSMKHTAAVSGLGVRATTCI